MSLRTFLAATVATTTVLVAGNASASFHLMKVVEVFGGPNGAHYVQLEMLADGQNSLGGHAITVFDTNDVEVDKVNLAAVTKGTAGATVLIGTATVKATYGVTPDFATMKALNPAGGKVCFDAIPVDCFTWGGYPNKTGFGAPFAALGVNAAKRDRAPGDPTKLEAADDTNDSAADFDTANPNPKNNKGEEPAPDAGPGTSSSSSTGGNTSSSTGGNASSSGTSGVTTNPSSSASSSSSGSSAAPAATPADDSGCNTAGDTGALTALPFLALVGLIAAKRRRS